MDAFDAARGTAMLLVCLSHFAAVYFRTEYESATVLGAEIGLIASPTFIALSGMMMGLMSVVYRRGFNTLSIKLADRALFLLTIGHFLLIISRWWFERDHVNALRTTVITDAVGVCVLLGVWLVRVTRPITRVAIGLVLFTVAWVLIFAWHPQGTAPNVIRDILVGGLPNRVMWYTVPLMQWAAVYITCTAIGQKVGSLYLQDERKKVERIFAFIGLASVTTAVALRVASWSLRPENLASPSDWSWEPFFSPWSKLAPSPVYVLFFGGIGMVLVSIVIALSHRRLAPRALGSVTRIGRSSLAVFVFQNYLYYTLLGELSLAKTNWWPLYYLVSLVPVFLFARWWDKRQLNRVLTVGLDRLIKRSSPPREPAAQPLRPDRWSIREIDPKATAKLD